jgi:hypothetical protein
LASDSKFPWSASDNAAFRRLVITNGLGCGHDRQRAELRSSQESGGRRPGLAEFRRAARFQRPLNHLSPTFVPSFFPMNRHFLLDALSGPSQRLRETRNSRSLEKTLTSVLLVRGRTVSSSS